MLNNNVCEGLLIVGNQIAYPDIGIQNIPIYPHIYFLLCVLFYLSGPL